MLGQFCFSTLALRQEYRVLAKQLAGNLEQYAPGVTLVIGTDRPDDFQACSNVWAFKLEQQGILHCYHDKRFVLEQALTRFRNAIQIDADSQIVGALPSELDQATGLSAIHVENLLDHVERYTPQRLSHLAKVAEKLNISLESTSYIGEALCAVSAEGDKTVEFIKQWGIIGSYLELHGIHAGEGNAIGLAAAKAGLAIANPVWLQAINQSRIHLDASNKSTAIPKPTWGMKRKLGYHYRLNRSRLLALQNFAFFYQ
jgi:hypothetical protein